jgi:hypothetical protein
LKAQINKTDCNNARGIAQMMRVGALKSHCDSGPASNPIRLNRSQHRSVGAQFIRPADHSLP